MSVVEDFDCHGVDVKGLFGIVEMVFEFWVWDQCYYSVGAGCCEKKEGVGYVVQVWVPLRTFLTTLNFNTRSEVTELGFGGIDLDSPLVT